MNYKKPAFWVEIGVILLVIVVAVCFLTNQAEKDYRILDVSSGSQHESIEYNYAKGYWEGEYSYVDVEWTNHSDRAIGYGEGFALYKNGKRVASKENYGFDDVLYIIQPGDTVTIRYSMIPYKVDYSKSGIYRIENSFQFIGDSYMTDPHYMVYVEFEVGEYKE